MCTSYIIRQNYRNNKATTVTKGLFLISIRSEPYQTMRGSWNLSESLKTKYAKNESLQSRHMRQYCHMSHATQYI